jgi:putative acetyltransferase
MITYLRTDSDNKDFQKLVAALDEYLRILDGEEHAFYAQLNKTDKIKTVVVAYENETAVGCGAIREFDKSAVEVKRMWVPENKRGQGIATGVLKELEKWAAALNYEKCILETGKRQPEAIALYEKNNYKIIPNFGKYNNVENSVCFEKKLNP